MTCNVFGGTLNLAQSATSDERTERQTDRTVVSNYYYYYYYIIVHEVQQHKL